MSLEHARAMSRTRVMEPALEFLKAKPGAEKAVHPTRKKRIKGKTAPAVSARGDAPRGGEKGTPVPTDFQGMRKVDAPVKYPRLPTESQLRDNAAKKQQCSFATVLMPASHKID